MNTSSSRRDYEEKSEAARRFTPCLDGLLCRLRERVADWGDRALSVTERLLGRLWHIISQEPVDPVAMALVIWSVAQAIRVGQAATVLPLPHTTDPEWQPAVTMIDTTTDFWRIILPHPAIGFWWLIVGAMGTLLGLATNKRFLVLVSLLLQLSFYGFAAIAVLTHLGFLSAMPWIAPFIISWWVFAHTYSRYAERRAVETEVEASMQLIGMLIEMLPADDLAQSRKSGGAPVPK